MAHTTVDVLACAVRYIRARREDTKLCKPANAPWPMSFTPLPMTTDVRFSQFIKAAGPMDIATPMGESEMTSEATCEPRKAPAEMLSPTLRRALSKVTLARRVSRKASSTTAIEAGSVIEADKHKPFWPMTVSTGEGLTFESRSQPTNAFAPVPVTALRLHGRELGCQAVRAGGEDASQHDGAEWHGLRLDLLDVPCVLGAIPVSFSRIAFSSAMSVQALRGREHLS